MYIFKLNNGLIWCCADDSYEFSEPVRKYLKADHPKIEALEAVRDVALRVLEYDPFEKESALREELRTSLDKAKD